MPRLIKFSGALKTAAGAPLTGVHGLTIAIYKDQQNGSPIWMETQNADLDEQGRYSILLGATRNDGVPLDLFTVDEPRWLGVQVQLPGYQEEARVLLVSVPYALKAADAETVGGLPATSFVLTPEAAQKVAASGGTVAKGGVWSAQSTTGLPTAATAGSAGFLGVFTDTTNLGNSAFFQSGASIGLGTTSPQALLDVRKPITTFDVVNNLALFGYSGFGNRSVEIQQIANPSTANQYIFFNGGLGSASTTTTPTVTTPLGYAAGLEYVDGALSLVYNPTLGVTDGAMSRALTLDTSSGRIGVGTTNPLAQLDVRKGITTDQVNALAVFGYSGGVNRSIDIQQIGNAVTANQYIFFNGGLGSASTTSAPRLTTPFGFATGLEYVDGMFSIVYNPVEGVTNGTLTRGVSLQATTGNVGIGTSAPSQRLEVAGAVKASGGVVFGDSTAQTTAGISQATADLRYAPIGAIGPTGPTGPTGATGPTGPTGPGLSNIGSPATANSQGGGWNGCEMGQIILSASAFLHGVPADGRLLAINTNQALFSLLGTTYGGDGRTTFALPDLRPITPNNMVYVICTIGIFPSPNPGVLKKTATARGIKGVSGVSGPTGARSPAGQRR